MLFNKIIFIVVALNLTCLCGCSVNKTVYTCPFGVGYLTRSDYETIADQDLISDEFATWLLETNLYCEANS